MSDLLGDIITPDPTPRSTLSAAAAVARLPRDAAGIPMKSPGPCKKKPPPQPVAGLAKAPPQVLIDECTAAVEAIHAEEARRAIINQHRAKATPPMLPQPPQANFRASERSQEEHDAKAASEAQAYEEQRIANIAKKKKGEEARVASAKRPPPRLMQKQPPDAVPLKPRIVTGSRTT